MSVDIHIRDISVAAKRKDMVDEAVRRHGPEVLCSVLPKAGYGNFHAKVNEIAGTFVGWVHNPTDHDMRLSATGDDYDAVRFVVLATFVRQRGDEWGQQVVKEHDLEPTPFVIDTADLISVAEVDEFMQKEETP